MLPTTQTLMLLLFSLTIVLVLLAEFGRNMTFKRVMAAASIVTVTAAIGVLVQDPPRGGDWPTLSWEMRGSPARKAQRRTAYVRTGGEDERRDEVDVVEEDRKTALASEDSTAERLQHMMVMAFHKPPTPGRAAGDVVRDCAACPEMILVPAGSAAIGAEPGDAAALAAERPQAVVRIWPGFFMAKAEVSAAEYQAFATATGRAASRCLDGEGEAGVAAVTCVTHGDARAYAAWLSRTTGKTYRLPSAAEWEYAARAGDDAVADLAPAAARPAAHEIVTRTHVWGLVGLGGGVAEIVADCWDGDLRRMPSNGEAFEPDARCASRVLKDGANGEMAQWRRPSARRPLAGDLATPRIGFRVMRALN